MKKAKTKEIHAVEFGCETPMKFYEKCASCPRLAEPCPDLILGKDLLSAKKKLVYHTTQSSKDTISAHEFNCLAPLRYYEKTRMNCGHKGRCREEGLLIALLKKGRTLSHAQKTAIQLPRPERIRPAETVPQVQEAGEASS